MAEKESITIEELLDKSLILPERINIQSDQAGSSEEWMAA